MRFDKTTLQQGTLNAQSAQETPSTFGETNNSDQVTPARDLTKSPQRMAGQMGVRAFALMNDPEEANRTNQWMSMFGMSNQGAAFNQAKMMGGMPPQQG